jgi:hypothetical protein
MGKTIAELSAAATAAVEPEFVTRANANFGGVDPLGMRQINFDLMDQVFPGLNNAARHIRPFVVVTWAWRRASQLAQATGASNISDDVLRDFVDRIEVLYVLSQLRHDKDSDLPGRQYLARWLMGSELTFSGPKWKKRRSERAYSTALSAPVAYGPGLKALGWLRPHPTFPTIMQPAQEVAPALDALEAALRPALNHEAFSKLGSATVTDDLLSGWGELWSLNKVTRAEAEVMKKLLIGDAAPPGRRFGMHLMLAASTHAKSIESSTLRAVMSGAPTKFRPVRELIDIRDMWRRVQVRQLFRLSLESVLYWMMLNLEGPPRPIEALVDVFLSQLPASHDATAGEWLLELTSLEGGPTELINRIQQACDSENQVDLPYSIVLGLALCLTEPVEKEQVPQPVERLPLARARAEATARAEASVHEFMRHVFESWVLAQHGYWSVGRGLADARGGGHTLLRLRIILDEGGWTLTPGARVGNAPRPTPDRLDTAITLARECGLL